MDFPLIIKNQQRSLDIFGSSKWQLGDPPTAWHVDFTGYEKVLKPSFSGHFPGFADDPAYIYILYYITILYHIILCYVKLYHIISYYNIIYYIILCYIILYYGMLNYIISYHIILYYIYISSPGQLRLPGESSLDLTGICTLALGTALLHHGYNPVQLRPITPGIGSWP